MQPPSLLDWLKSRLAQPRLQRIFRFGLAGVSALWGGYSLYAHGRQDVVGFFFLGLAVGLFFWGLSVRGEGAPDPTLPAVSLGQRAVASGEDAAARRERRQRLLAALRIPSAIVLAVIGQAALSGQPPNAWVGGSILLLGVLVFLGAVWYSGQIGPARAAPGPWGALRLEFRWWLLALVAVTGAYAFLAAGGNRFRFGGVVAWIAVVGLWLSATWEWDRPLMARLRAVWDRAVAALQAPAFTFNLSRTAVLFFLVLGVGAYFRFAYLRTIPPEMTSDHVEKLFDVSDVLNGAYPVYFERNTGREPLQFYFAVLLIKWIGTGLTMLTLKITSAVAGLLLLPYVYLLGRELEDDLFGLLAMLLTAISFWATAISRVGLRFPLSPVFVAPVMVYLLRGLRTGQRNAFLLSGLFLGASLYGYSTIRVLPVVVLAAILWAALWPQPAENRRRLAANTVLLYATAFVVFLPLYRYASEPDSYFWYRSLSRVSTTENDIVGSAVRIFLDNNWKALRMFNWHGDTVWVNTIPGVPVLDQVSGALFVCGLAFLLVRLFVRRDRVAGLLLLVIPILLLPSTLSVAFPDENPSVVRASGAIPVIFIITAYPLWLLARQAVAAWPGRGGRWVAGLSPGLLLVTAESINRQLYFVRYPAQYTQSAQNASEIGEVVHDYAVTLGSYDRAYICLHPHWADTRAVGLYAGQAGWENVLPADEFGRLAGDPRPLLVIVNPRSAECLAAMRQFFPIGKYSQYSSARGPDKDFLMYFVPGTVDMDTSNLPQP